MATCTAAIGKTKNKRQWIYAKKVNGPLFRYRQYVGYTLLLLLFAAPFIKINGEPFLLFNVVERKFSIFGTIFYPQDLYLFVFAMLIFMVGVVLFTVVYGRVWCGWTCPQTIFMELIFRRIEYWIEGDANQQRKLNEGPNTSAKITKKVSKHALFLAISFLISNIFLSYIIGIDALIEIITDPIGQHMGGLISLLLFTLVFYAVFAFLRELVCTTVCPYGRLQGVLLDDQSITVAYNSKRGEPRGKHQKTIGAQTLGDCVDCGLCVHVCPTGIDIRRGIQMECVNCTACIDACDQVMEKLKKPKRLIGFYTLREIEQDLPKSKNVRAIAYSAVLLLLMGIFSWLIFSRTPVDGTLLRANGTTYIMRDDGTVANMYNLELINKTHQTMAIAVQLSDKTYQVQLIGTKREMKAGESLELGLLLYTPKQAVIAYKTSVDILIVSEGKIMKKMQTTFIAPPKGGF